VPLNDDAMAILGGQHLQQHANAVSGVDTNLAQIKKALSEDTLSA
jgi:hypothetical protein